MSKKKTMMPTTSRVSGWICFIIMAMSSAPPAMTELMTPKL